MKQSPRYQWHDGYLKLLLASVFLFGSWNLLQGQHHSHPRYDAESRMLKKNEIIQSLRSFRPNEQAVVVELTEKEIDQSVKQSVRIIGEGFLQISNTDWIYFISTSSHTDANAGDMTLAIDQSGNVYQNDGHVCGGIVHFQTFERQKPRNSDQFFQLFKSDTDDIGWNKVTFK